MKLSRYLLYGCGQLGVMLLARFFFVWIVRFGDVGGREGMPPADAAAAGALLGAVGYVFLAFRIFDAVTDPLAGVLGTIPYEVACSVSARVPRVCLP